MKKETQKYTGISYGERYIFLLLHKIFEDCFHGNSCIVNQVINLDFRYCWVTIFTSHLYIPNNDNGQFQKWKVGCFI